MKILQVLSAAAAVLLVASGPSLAAKRVHRGVDAYASGAVSADRSGAYNYGPARSVRAQAPAHWQLYSSPVYHGQNLPYPDRPYGDPDGW